MSSESLSSFSTFTTITSVLLNYILIVLILTRSPTTFGVYKYLMIYTSIFELLYSMWDLVVNPLAFTYKSTFVIFWVPGRISNDILGLGKPQTYLLLISYCGFFGFSLAVFAVQFIYRYAAINKNFMTTFLSGRKIALLFLAPIVSSLWWGSACYFGLQADDKSDRFIKNYTRNHYHQDIRTISYLRGYFYPGKDLDWGQAAPVVHLWTCLVISMTCVLYFGIKCYLDIREMFEYCNTSSPLIRNLHRQTFLALVGQTTIPVVLMYIPITMFMLFPMLNIDIGILGSFITYTIALYPAIDPLPQMLIVKNYRDAIRDFVINVLSHWNSEHREDELDPPATGQKVINARGL